jgi:predicted permease
MIWRVLRLALPGGYRRAWSEELLQTHIDAGEVTNVSAAGFWMAVAYDVLVTSLRARGDVWRSRRRGVRGTGGVRASVVMARRELSRGPGFALVVALILGVGITATLTMYAVLDRLLLSPPAHLQDAGSLRRIYVHGMSHFTQKDEYSAALAWPDVVAMKKTPSFSAMAVFSYARDLTIGRSENSEKVPVVGASASTFPTFGLRPALGRFYTEAEDAVDAEDHVAVIGYDLWMRRYNGRRDVLGQSLAVGKGDYRIIGVAPRGFTGAAISPVDVWLPLMTSAVVEQGTYWQEAATWYWVDAVARLKDGAADDLASGQATTLYQNSRADEKSTDKNARVVLGSIIPGRGPTPTRETIVAKMLGVVAVLVLLMTCANAGNLFLARGVHRRRALAIQTAIGASRGSIIAQMFTEALFIAFAAGLFAFGVLRITVPPLFRILLPDATPPELGSLRIAVMTFVFALGTAALAGLLTAIRSSRVAPFEALRAGRSTARTSSLRRSLLAVQAAFAVILLLGAGLFLRSLHNAASVDLGLSLDTRAVDFELTNGGGPDDRDKVSALYAAAELLRHQPGVESAAVTSWPPFNGSLGLMVDLPGPDSVVRGPAGPFYVAAGTDFFHTLGMRIVRGRAFTDQDDRPNVRVAIVNESMARAVWPGRNPVGQCMLVVSNPKKETPCTTIVGVANDYRERIDDVDADERYYLPPYHPDAFASGSANFVLVRMVPGTQVGDGALISAIRSRVPGIRIVESRTLRSMISSQLRSWQLGAALLTMFGILALVVASAGLYSVVAFEVSQRRFELGVRSALGATARRMITALLSDVLRTTLLGVCVGLLASLLLGRLTASLLFGVEPTDLRVYAGVIAVLCGVGVMAIALPAWRATRIDPRTALAQE